MDIVLTEIQFQNEKHKKQFHFHIISINGFIFFNPVSYSIGVGYIHPILSISPENRFIINV